MSITLLTPTRKRPVRLRQMIDSAFQTASTPPEIICYIGDEDDSYSAAHFPDVTLVHGPRLIFSDHWNALLPHAHGEILMQCADDVIFRTPGWDVEIEKAFNLYPDHIVLVYADDLGPSGKTFASLPFVHRKWVEAVGYFTGPGFVADFSDLWCWDVAQMIGRVKYVDIQIEHAHWLWGKAVKDQTYTENLARYQEKRPDLNYQSRLAERVADAEKLRKVIHEASSCSC